MTLREQIAQQAMSLSVEDREYVADVLERSLSSETPLSSDVAEAWSQEIERRITAYDRGESTAVEFDVAMTSLRNALASRRANQTR
ncbi:addiction module protein [Planctomicrobium piriforme]|uniref:Putative addiction module component n=1 Tax=Planctomicrobium piriforme TaxID=1576369 RepID=A0A1I3LWR7_9PLAN|nr:addiction module protein [Planctomicrobium piriforme]SFI89010.1 Putative addiction module component [Planctomicrobium piriforme]